MSENPIVPVTGAVPAAPKVNEALVRLEQAFGDTFLCEPSSVRNAGMAHLQSIRAAAARLDAADEAVLRNVVTSYVKSLEANRGKHTSPNTTISAGALTLDVLEGFLTQEGLELGTAARLSGTAGLFSSPTRVTVSRVSGADTLAALTLPTRPTDDCFVRADLLKLAGADKAYRLFEEMWQVFTTAAIKTPGRWIDVAYDGQTFRIGAFCSGTMVHGEGYAQAANNYIYMEGDCYRHRLLPYLQEQHGMALTTRASVTYTAAIGEDARHARAGRSLGGEIARQWEAQPGKGFKTITLHEKQIDVAVSEGNGKGRNIRVAKESVAALNEALEIVAGNPPVGDSIVAPKPRAQRSNARQRTVTMSGR